MTPSLSIIIPVRNAQYTLSRQVQRLLEMLPDLTNRFEVLIVDDHSADFTTDIAAEICREFPQVKFLRQAGKGPATGAKEGQKQAQGEIILVLEQGQFASPAELRQMWNVRQEARQVLQQVKKPLTISENLLERLGVWGKGAVQAATKTSLVSGTEATAADHRSASGNRLDESHPETPAKHAIPNFVNHLKHLIGGEESAGV